MSYRFLLTAASAKPGAFRFATQAVELQLDDQLHVNLVARDADSLAEATRFHFEGKGLPDETAALQAGERLRLRLRVLNAILGLGINVPIAESVSARLAPAVKEKVHDQSGVVVLDCVWGLSVLPDDGRHFQFVVTGRGHVFPSDPHYSLNALKLLWSLDLILDQRSEDALTIIGLATVETSERAAFLATYLAVEALVSRDRRSEAACTLIQGFQEQVRQSSLSDRETTSLFDTLGSLQLESFPTALMKLVDRISSPTELKGMPIRPFFSKCISVRNQIAHQADLDQGTNLPELTAGLREFVLCLVWTRNNIPSFEADIPASTITVPHLQIKLM